MGPNAADDTPQATPDPTPDPDRPGPAGTTLRADPGQGWEGILAALAGARPGDRVELADGDYRGDVPLRVPAGVTLAAVDPGRRAGAGDGVGPDPRPAPVPPAPVPARTGPPWPRRQQRTGLAVGIALGIIHADLA